MSPFSKEMHSRHKLGIRSYIYQVLNKPIGSQQRFQFPLAYTSSPHPHVKCPRELDLHVWPATRLSTRALVPSPSKERRALDEGVWAQHLVSPPHACRSCDPDGETTSLGLFSHLYLRSGDLTGSMYYRTKMNRSPETNQSSRFQFTTPTGIPLLCLLPFFFFRSTVSTLSFWGLQDYTQIKRLVNCGHFINALLVFVPFL